VSKSDGSNSATKVAKQADTQEDNSDDEMPELMPPRDGNDSDSGDNELAPLVPNVGILFQYFYI